MCVFVCVCLLFSIYVSVYTFAWIYILKTHIHTCMCLLIQSLSIFIRIHVYIYKWLAVLYQTSAHFNQPSCIERPHWPSVWPCLVLWEEPIEVHTQALKQFTVFRMNSCWAMYHVTHGEGLSNNWFEEAAVEVVRLSFMEWRLAGLWATRCVRMT